MAALYEAVMCEQKLVKIMSETVPAGPVGCLEYYVGSRIGNYSRYRMSYPQGPGLPDIRAQMTAHRAVYILTYRRADMIGEPCTGHVSHLCHNSRCVNVTHLTLEPSAANTQRQFCVSLQQCRGSCVPACIFPSPPPP